jgi:hypothetical protein
MVREGNDVNLVLNRAALDEHWVGPWWDGLQ